MKVCIAEKPSVAREIASILGAQTRKDGYIEGNGYCVTWTFGHLCTLKTPDDYTPAWKRWSIETLPMIPDMFDTKLIKNKGVGKQFKIIKGLVNECTEVINCGDAGIEGELIQRWVLQRAACKKPVKRLWISSLTEEAIREGFSNLKDSSEYDLLYAAGSARAIGDWLLGMNASRLYTLKYASGKGVLSIGRVQTPTLALIVNRHLEIENFTPEKYWELKTEYRDITFTAIDGKFKENQKAADILESIRDESFTITSFTRKKGKESPPQLFDLTSLQVECNKKFNFTADSTLKTVQKLYEKKAITYPRVDTRFLPSDMYPKISGIMKGLGGYRNFTEPLLKNEMRKSKKIFDDEKITDHHAIIPTGKNPAGLTSQEQKIFDAVARRFIAAFYPDSIVSNTTVLGKVKEVKFKATGKQILEKGWRELYPREENKEAEEKKETQLIPEFEEGESGPHQPELQEKETKPPKHYTEATLLRAMETAGKQVDDEELRQLMKENGIGRPSTRAAVIETLFRRYYVTRSKKSLIPTTTGIQLIGTIRNELLKSVELTGIWEKKLRQIEKGEYEQSTFLSEMKEMVTTLVSDVRLESGKSISVEGQKTKSKKSPGKKPATAGKLKNRPAPTEPVQCPKCGLGKIIKGNKAYGCSEFRQGCNFVVSFTIEGKKLTEKQIFSLIQKGKTGILSGFTSNGEKTKGQIVLDKEHRPVFKPEAVKKNESAKSPQSTVIVCPICGRGTMIRGRTAYGCSRFREGCRFIIPFEQLKQRFNTGDLSMEIVKHFASNS